MQPASHRDCHTRTDPAHTHRTTSTATSSAPYTCPIMTSALALQSQHRNANLAPAKTYSANADSRGVQAAVKLPSCKTVGDLQLCSLGDYQLLVPAADAALGSLRFQPDAAESVVHASHRNTPAVGVSLPTMFMSSRHNTSCASSHAASTRRSTGRSEGANNSRPEGQRSTLQLQRLNFQCELECSSCRFLGVAGCCWACLRSPSSNPLYGMTGAVPTGAPAMCRGVSFPYAHCRKGITAGAYCCTTAYTVAR